MAPRTGPPLKILEIQIEMDRDVHVIQQSRTITDQDPVGSHRAARAKNEI